MNREQIEPREIINGIVNLINDPSIRSEIVYDTHYNHVTMKCNQCAVEESRIYFLGEETTLEWKPTYYCRCEMVGEDFLIHLNCNVYLQFHRLSETRFWNEVEKSKIVGEEFHFNYDKKTIAERIYFDFLFGQCGKNYKIVTKLATKNQYWQLIRKAFPTASEILEENRSFFFVVDDFCVKAKGLRFDATWIPGKRIPHIKNKDFEFLLHEEFAESFYLNQFTEFGLVHFIHCEKLNQLEIVLGNRWFIDLYEFPSERLDEYQEYTENIEDC